MQLLGRTRRADEMNRSLNRDRIRIQGLDGSCELSGKVSTYKNVEFGKCCLVSETATSMRFRSYLCLCEPAADRATHDAKTTDVRDEVGMQKEENCGVGKGPCGN